MKKYIFTLIAICIVASLLSAWSKKEFKYEIPNGQLIMRNDEYIVNSTDDIMTMQGSGGTDNTDLSVDLDGEAPIMYSISDSSVTVNDNLVMGTSQYLQLAIVNYLPASKFGIGALILYTGNSSYELYIATEKPVGTQSWQKVGAQ